MSKLVLLVLYSLVTLTAFPQTSIWKITNKENFLYIGGTVHVLKSQDYPLPNEFDSLYNLTQAVVLESGWIGDAPNISERLDSISMYNAEISLRNILEDTVYQKLRAAWDNINLSNVNLPNISKANFDSYKPPIIIETLEYSRLRKLNYDTIGVDIYIYNKAVKDNRKVIFLETPEDQTAIFANCANGWENDYVLNRLKDLESLEEDMNSSIASWRNGNIKIDYDERFKTNYPRLYKTLVVERNNAWIPKIKECIDNENIEFILVGLGHLYGTDGILYQLELKGYEIEQIQ